MIELFIENTKIDLKDDIDISFTYESIDPDKLSSIKNTFSKTVSVPGTPSNNIAFGHIFRLDRIINENIATPIGSGYDPHKRVNWIINKNGFVISQGYCTLDNIKVKDYTEITYELTLYGGIGNLFFELTYDSNADNLNLLNLADLYYNWRPKTALSGYGTAMTELEEANDTLMLCSPSIIAHAWHSLVPVNASGTTDIDKDIVFVPCYSGLNEEFDSKHMLVNINNQIWGGAPIPASTKSKLNNSFPRTLNAIEDNAGSAASETYYALDSALGATGTSRYGLVTFSRDLDPWEAGDLRVTDMPVAIRFSKLMYAIKEYASRKGYEINFDNDILESFHYKYSWLLLGKVLKSLDKIVTVTLDASSWDTFEAHYLWKQEDHSCSTVDDLPYQPINMPISPTEPGYYSAKIDSGRYTFLANYTAKWHMKGHMWSSASMIDDILPNNGDGNFSFSYFKAPLNSSATKGWQIWYAYAVVNVIQIGADRLKAIADVIYPRGYNAKGFGKLYKNYFGRNSYATDRVASLLATKYGVATSDVVFHDCDLSIDNISQNSSTYITEFDVVCSSAKCSTIVEVTEESEMISVDQYRVPVWALCEWSAGSPSVYTTAGILGETTPTPTAPWGWTNMNDAITSLINYNNEVMTESWDVFESANDEDDPVAWNTGVSLSLDSSSFNGFLTQVSSGYSNIQLKKRELFANTSTPMKYLVDFCKLMNYKLVYDDTNKRLDIMPLKKYYNGGTYNIDSLVDYAREMSMKVVPNCKTIEIGLETLETYPVSLFNKISKRKFDTETYNTKIEFIGEDKKLLDNLVYKNTSEWQQSSVFYNITPQFPRAYNTPTISWTLFKQGTTLDNIQKNEFFTEAVNVLSSFQLLDKTDYMPKQALFDKDNKMVSDIANSLVFLNGFVRNYDYTPVSDAGQEEIVDRAIWPRVVLTSDTPLQIYLNGQRCYMADFKYYNNQFTSWGAYSLDSDTSTSWVLPFFSKDLYNMYNPSVDIWTKSTDKIASWNLADLKDATSSSSLIDNFVSLVDVGFITDPKYNYTETVTSTTIWDDPVTGPNVYTFNEVPADDEGFTERPYDMCWKDYLDDLYDTDTRDVTLWVDLSKFGDGNSIMRKIYSWKSHLWVITKISNFRVSDIIHDKFTKVTMHKIKDISTWTI